MATKVYQHLKFLEHLTYVQIGEKNVPIHFKNGVAAPRRIRGTFVTQNPDIMEALDNDERNGKLWKCIKGAEITPNKSHAKKPVKKVEQVAEEEVNLIEVTGIKTVQAAKEFLVKKIEGLDEATLTNKEAVMQAAEGSGYTFPGLK